MSEIEIKDVSYRIGKLEVRTAIHVGRRLGPVLVGMMISASSGAGQNVDVLYALSEKFAGMDNETVDYVIDNCLAVVERETEKGTWTKVAATNGRLMFSDIEPTDVLNLTRAVIQENFSSFLPALG